MKDVLRWLVKESNYIYMYGAIISFMLLSFIGSGDLLGVYCGLAIMCCASVGGYSHYHKLKKIGKWDKKNKSVKK